MWDRASEQTFTKAEAEAYVGQTVQTTGGNATIKGVFCDGPDSYILEDTNGHLIYKSHNHCPYVITD